MPVLFNYDDVDAVPMAPGVARRPLITPERVGNDCIVLDRWTMAAGSVVPVHVVALPVLAYVAIIGLPWRYPISRDSQRQMREIIEERENLARREATGAL